ncbi:MAG: phosphatase PAP2 family protein [Campylobacterota bacterium]|nr:phosphatase PAP2 family protein [Campylobacterota bacterium]
MRLLVILLLSFHIVYSLELDKKVTLDDKGFWGAHYDVPRYSVYAMIAVTVYEGTETRLGMTSWKALESGVLSQLLAEGTKKLTGRERPRDAETPSEWGEDGASFFSGHVSGMTAIITPYILEYQEEYPIVHSLWLLSAYQMVGRVKAQAHWQSDVIVGALVGFATGYFVHTREYPLSLYFDSDKVVLGLKHRF